MKALNSYSRFVTSGWVGFLIGAVLPLGFILTLIVAIYGAAHTYPATMENRQAVIAPSADAGTIDDGSLPDGSGGGGDAGVCTGKPQQFDYSLPTDVEYALYRWYCGYNSEGIGLYNWIGLQLGVPQEGLFVDLKDAAHQDPKGVAFRCLWLIKLESVYRPGYRANVNEPIHVQIEQRDWLDAQIALNGDCSVK